MSTVRALTVALATMLLLVPSKPRAADDAYDVVRYGRDCAKLIAEAPPFNCLDGDVVPITVDGKTPETWTRHMTCDRPAYLP